jgi:tRNA(fMet)-specific endonuclease VapC
MSGRFLLDTSVVVELLLGEPAATARAKSAGEVYLPAIALGELLYGAKLSSRPAENESRVQSLLNTIPILTCNADTARYYADIKLSLRTKGRPIPENDIWIAALSIQHGLSVATRDAHFNEVDNLSIDPWR